ncbi:putative clathrin assembly protein At4g40080 [Diospyros lotus]|uniref:putative clathrin assembly protein At4g40080 n=1 Tax=Diospyros lotus TaxID=55363 RepID=UPI0022524748|nr:putative clathrin assembly protein At4g40080 [Diospyros lotus]
MDRRTKLVRDFIGILKDRASLIKAALTVKRSTSIARAAVIHATTHRSSSFPPEHCLAAVLSLGLGSRATASACIAAIMDRLHRTGDTFVALKCLITLHHVVARGSFILKDQLSIFPASGGHNFLNLSTFRDGRDVETSEFSTWVRWYAGFLESNLTTSRVLGTYVSSSSLSKDRFTITSLLDLELMSETEALVAMVEEISRAPDSVDCQRNDLVYEIVNLVGDDYRSTQRQIWVRLNEWGKRISRLDVDELAKLTRCLERLEESRERILVLFVSRKRNDAFWELVKETKRKAVKVAEERERARWLVVSESTRLGERAVRPGRVLSLAYGMEVNGRGADRVAISVLPATA